MTKNYRYDAFCVEIGKAENDANPWRYCGEYWDEETGTVYLKARYYSPRTGRFLSEDPIRDGLNWYTYCSGNPVGFIDPSGLKAGDLFTSADEAAIDFFYEYYGITDFTQYEQATTIYSILKLDRKSKGYVRYYSYVEPEIGNPHSVNVEKTKDLMPKRSSFVAYAHTHPGSESTLHANNSDKFSSGDVEFVKTTKSGLYVLTPLNNIYLLTHDDIENRNLTGKLVAFDLDFRQLAYQEQYDLAIKYGKALKNHIKSCTNYYHRDAFLETSQAFRMYEMLIKIRRQNSGQSAM